MLEVYSDQISGWYMQLERSPFYRSSHKYSHNIHHVNTCSLQTKVHLLAQECHTNVSLIIIIIIVIDIIVLFLKGDCFSIKSLQLYSSYLPS